MYEKSNKSNISVDLLSGGVSDYLSSDTGALPADDAGTVSPGDSPHPGSELLAPGNSVSSGNSDVSAGEAVPVSSDTLQDYTPVLSQIQEDISGINSLLLMIFMLLVCKWTYSVISSAVNKFTSTGR